MDSDHAPSSSMAELAALAKLLEEHRPKLRAMIRRRIDLSLASRLDADDVLSEAFFRAQRRWSSFAESGMTPYSWLYRIALDCVIEAWRRETRDGRDPDREMPFPEGSSAQLGLNLIATATTPRKAAARKELQAQMRQTLEMLGPRDQEILWMRHYDQLRARPARPLRRLAMWARRNKGWAAATGTILRHGFHHCFLGENLHPEEGTPSRFQSNATAAITQYQRGTAAFVFFFIFFLRFRRAQAQGT